MTGSTTGATPAPVRPTVKLVLLDEQDRMLLIQGRDPATGADHWFPVGGGVEPGEGLQAAAAREAWEETGLERLSPGALVWTRDVVYAYAGKSVPVHEDWLLCRVEHFEPAPAALSEFERTSIRTFRWWPAAELAATTYSVLPSDLGARLTALVRDGIPPRPIDITSPHDVVGAHR